MKMRTPNKFLQVVPCTGRGDRGRHWMVIDSICHRTAGLLCVRLKQTFTAHCKNRDPHRPQSRWVEQVADFMQHQCPS